MCASWAQAIFDFAVARGFHVPPLDMQDDVNGPEVAQINKTILGCLPRGRKVPPLLTDWLEPQLFRIDDTPAVQTLPVGKRIPDSVKRFPQGSKLAGSRTTACSSCPSLHRLAFQENHVIL